MWHSMRSAGAVAGLGVARGAVALAVRGAALPQVESFDMPSDVEVRARAQAHTASDLRSAVRRVRAPGHRGTGAVRAVIGNDLACHWMLRPPRGARSLCEIQAVAQARFAALFDESVAEWRVTGDWRTDRPFICTAVPRWVLADVEATGPGNLPVACIGTLLGRALELFHRRIPDSGWCCIQSPRSLALLHLYDGLPSSLRVVPLKPEATHESVVGGAVDALHREAACLALPPVVSATWLDLTAPTQCPDRASNAFHEGVRLTVLRLRHRPGASPKPVGSLQEAGVAALLGGSEPVSLA